MVFSLFKRKDPICGMREEKGKGIEKHGHWFCHENCLREYEKVVGKSSKKIGKGCCY